MRNDWCLEAKPIGFVSIARRPYRGLYVRFLQWHMAMKATRHELFSERHGRTRTYRVAGLSLTFRRVRESA